MIRGTPLLVQLFILYYGLPQFGPVRDSALWPLLRDPWFCAWAAFTINTAAYTTEIFAGAIRTTPSGEIEAARATGLTRAQVFRDVFWPGAWRRALPQYGNEVVQLMHATALASTVTIVEILRVGRDVYTNHLVIPESFGLAAVFYLGLTRRADLGLPRAGAALPAPPGPARQRRHPSRTPESHCRCLNRPSLFPAADRAAGTTS